MHFSVKKLPKQENIPVGCILPTLHQTGVSLTEIPLDRDPPERDPPKEYGTRDRDPLEGTWDQAAK